MTTAHRSVLPFGSWPTPITSELVVAGAARISDVQVDGDDVLWAEGRPAEGGRTQLVRLAADGTTTDVLPGYGNARTAVHEYGGAGWWVRNGVVWFAEWADQRVYRLEPGGEPVPITPEPAKPRGDRYADADPSPDGDRIVCIREHHPRDGHTATDVRNEVVQLAAHTPSEPEVLVSGPDFVAAPRLRHDGGALCWVQWNHPSMPWDDSELVVRDLATGRETVVAGGPGESVQQPTWQPDGSLWFVSDRSGWWNLYRWDGAATHPVVEIAAEIGEPGWALGSSRYAVLPGGEVVFARWSGGRDGLALRHPDNHPGGHPDSHPDSGPGGHQDGAITELDLPFTAIGKVRATPDGAVLVVAGTPTAEPGVYRVDLDGNSTALRPPRDLGVDPGYLSVPEPVDFGSVAPDGAPREAHALLYPPASASHRGPDGDEPPLLVVIHGGPTGAAAPVLDVGKQYWTSRGFAVVDVNYGGSTGYGRAYREQLHGAWGVVDVADCLAAARHLAEQGRADPQRLCIRGGSAGGYTVLAARTRDDTPFAAGADHFGVADLEALAAETHKFESRYLDRLVGRYPAEREVYRQRSPIHHVDRLRRPLIVLQGAEDEVVPPGQSEMIVEALRDRRVPVAYLLFEGEQHGFRRSENIRRALDAELSFYAQVLGFALPPDEGIEPVPVENLTGEPF